MVIFESAISCPPALCRGWPASGPGRLPPGPCLLAGVSAEVSGVKRDFACTLTRHFSPVLVALPVTVALEAGGADTYTLRAIPGLSRARILEGYQKLSSASFRGTLSNC